MSFIGDILTKRSTAPNPEKAKAPKDTHKPYAGESPQGMSITITKDGPYVVSGSVPLTEDAIVESADGSHLEYHRVREYETKEKYELCRCGYSKHKPFCDGTHADIGFDGEETAERVPYMRRVDEYPGPELDLLDDDRCAYARLCHRRGLDVWTLTEEAADEEMGRQAVGASWNCPTGRLEHHNVRDGEVYEQQLAPGITLLEDTQEGVSGPMFVHGSIPLISEDGTQYELRNRYALCRCGESMSKPFCDATHVTVGFYDGSAALEEGWTGKRDDEFKDMPDSL